MVFSLWSAGALAFLVWYKFTCPAVVAAVGFLPRVIAELSALREG